MDADDIVVARNDETHRYELTVDGVLAGFTEFHVDSQGRLVFPHTVVDPAFRGRGLGGIVVERAMTDVAERGETVVPLCPVVVKYLREYDVAGLKIDWPDGV